ncbi:MAG TPA: hypothetical protein DCX08_07810 [Porticoccaceae bacterium]|jgi:hypothetical protein|nr:hypothetical protein [Porticoccaceae bacterium]
MKKLIGLFALFCFVTIAQANDNFTVNAKLYDNKELIGLPTLVVNPNNEASISSDLYSFSLTLTPVDDSTVNLATELELVGERIAASLVVELGKEAIINIDGKELSVIVNKSSS